jgi:2-methylcitrate dehydratase PrpD
LEGSLGFSTVFAGKELNIDSIAGSLGKPYDIGSSYSIKPFPACGLTHRCIDGMLHLVKAQPFKPEEVEHIECHTPPMVREILVYSRPQSGLEGKFSLEYCMAAAIIDGEVSLRQFTDEKVLAAEAQRLISKVELKFLDVPKGRSLLNIPQAVKVQLKDGRTLFKEVQWPKGYSYNPMSWDEVAVKFCACAEGVLSKDRIEQCVEMAAKMETLDDVSSLMAILSKVNP